MIIPGLILLLIGILLILAFRNSRASCTVSVEAVISDILIQKLPRRGFYSYSYMPVFTYVYEGLTYTEKAELTTKDEKRFATGQKVTILVNPDRPAEIRYGSNTGFLIAGLILAAAGLLLTILSFM